MTAPFDPAVFGSPGAPPDFIDGETAEQRERRLIHWTLDHPLVNEWCKHDPTCAFRCYPDDGECECGMFRHHVHGTCGHVIQVG